MAKFQLVMRSGPNPGRSYPIEGSELIIGREASNPVAINDAEVSRKHARLTLHGESYVLEDLGSTNGTFVNGQRLTAGKVLNPGDSVSFGENIVLLYEAAYDPNATVMSAPKAAKTEAKAPKPEPAYSGQVPAGPAAEAPAKKAKKKFPLWLVIVVIVLVVICACAAFFVIIDQLRLWCQVVPFLVPLLGGTC